jgi:hypothetical protein
MCSFFNQSEDEETRSRKIRAAFPLGEFLASTLLHFVFNKKITAKSDEVMYFFGVFLETIYEFMVYFIISLFVFIYYFLFFALGHEFNQL